MELQQGVQKIIERNKPQWEAMQAIYSNCADYIKPGDGAYQTGFRTTLNWSRGTGKTFFLMDMCANVAFDLPQAVTGLWSATYKSVQNIVLGQSAKIWRQHGLTEYDEKYNKYGNYVVNKAPPKHFHRPHNTPRIFENTVSFANGHMVKMISADRPDTQRGDNLDVLIGDEVGFSKRDLYHKILLPSLRDNKLVYKDPRPGRKGFNHPLHWLSILVSSLPYTQSGRWFLENEERANKSPERHYFSRANAYDNLKNLPGDFIESQREELNDIEFMVEIENKILTRLPNGFYPSFDDSIHVDTRYTYEFNKSDGRHIEYDRFYESLRPLDMSWDFNGYFTCATISQELDKYYVFNNEFFAKETTTTLIEKVCDDFIKEYKDHLKKIVYLYGDRSGKNKDPDRNQSFYQKITQKLTMAGWTVIDMTANTYPSYKNRYMLISDLLGENKPRFPKIRIHAEKCKSLIIAIQNAGILEKETFEKDKSSEGSSNGIQQEFATHFTDAFDYVLYSKFNSLSDFGTTRSLPFKSRSR